jgi:copper homeostasis protein
MIRPRGGDFLYSDAEFEQMKHDLHTIRSASAPPGRLSGFVFGILDARGQVDVLRNSELVASARPLSCTFHRAFDETKDLDQALEDVIACGFKTILTSGGAGDAVAGAEVLGRLVERAKGRIIVMPGGGVRSSNIGLLKEKTRANWFHSSAVVGDEISVEEVRLLRRSL